MNITTIAAYAAVGTLLGMTAFCFDDIKKDYSAYQAKKERKASQAAFVSFAADYHSFEAKKARGHQELCGLYIILNTPLHQQKPGC